MAEPLMLRKGGMPRCCADTIFELLHKGCLVQREGQRVTCLHGCGGLMRFRNRAWEMDVTNTTGPNQAPVLEADDE